MYPYDDDERQINPPFGPSFGQQQGPPFGIPFGQQQGPPFGQPFGQQQGFPFGQFFPGGQPSMPPFGAPGGTAGPPGPPPNVTPSLAVAQQVQQQGVGVFAVDPGAIRPCRFRFIYIWLDNGQQFWAWLVFVGRDSVSGFRWTGFRWVYFGVDRRRIDAFVCY